jgi:predicted GIY-YIG superfamily endonuclease
MFYVYLIQSLKNHRAYIGFTPHLTGWIRKHNRGYIAPTKPHHPWLLAYSEAYRAKKDAILREKALKSRGQAIKELKRRLKDSLHP